MKYWIILIFLLAAMQSFAQPKHAEIEEKDGKKYYVHIVQAGNSLWGIHVLYNVNVDEIVAANPGVENGIADGQKIYVPVKVVKEAEAPKMTTETRHLVKPQETMYGISKKYGLTIDQILKSNPSAEKGIKPGQELIIPSVEVSSVSTNPISNKDIKITFSDTIIDHVVLAHETIYSISKRFMVPVSDLTSVNQLKNNKIRPGDIIKIPIRKEKIQKAEIRTVKPVDVRQPDPELMYKEKEKYSIAILLPFFLDKGAGYSETVSDLATQFYMGAELAIDSLRKLGFNSKVFFYDSQNDTNVIKAILKKTEFATMDMVIGPLLPDKMGVVARWCKQNKVKYICPVAANSDILKDNPFVYAAIPSDLTLMDGAAKYLLNKAGQEQIILVKPTGEKDKMLYDRFRATYMSLPFAGTRPKIIETTQQDFKSFIKKGGNTTFVMPSLDETTTKKFMNSLSTTSNVVAGTITVFGTKEWLQFDEINGAYKNKYNYTFSASNDFNYASPAVKSLSKKYRKAYNADMPKMAVQGFDVVLYFTLKYLLLEDPSEGVMSDFQMVQKGSGNGYENNNCFILQQQDFEIVKIENEK